jgi:hypothetical protein
MFMARDNMASGYLLIRELLRPGHNSRWRRLLLYQVSIIPASVQFARLLYPLSSISSMIYSKILSLLYCVKYLPFLLQCKMTAAVPNSTPFLLKCKMEEAVCS